MEWSNFSQLHGPSRLTRRNLLKIVPPKYQGQHWIYFLNKRPPVFFFCFFFLHVYTLWKACILFKILTQHVSPHFRGWIYSGKSKEEEDLSKTFEMISSVLTLPSFPRFLAISFLLFHLPWVITSQNTSIIFI